MSVRLLAVTLAVSDPQREGRFWGGLLGREALPDRDGVLVPGTPTQVGLRFAPRDRERGAQRIHLHVTSADVGQHERVAAAAALGAAPVDIGQPADAAYVVLADPDGRPFCVIEPGNRFLAGTGLLGELACDGSRFVGVFWSEALDWPLVWDADEETAVQSSAGGTKVAWGGPPLVPQDGHHDEWLEIVADGDLDAEADRLVGFGGLVRGRTPYAIELTDPDGNLVVLRAEGPRWTDPGASLG